MKHSYLSIAATTACGLLAQTPPIQFRMMHDRFVPDHFGTAVPLGLAFADVDGDGDLDLHVATGPYFIGGQDLLYLNDGRGVFTDVTPSNLGFDNRSTEAALFVDVDGDGDLDLVHGNTPYLGASGQDRLFLNDGAGLFTDATASNLPVDQDLTTTLAAGDVDGDGDSDLVIGNQLDLGQPVANRLYLNDGTGVFTDATAGRLPTIAQSPARMVLADLDGDTDLDLVVCNRGGSSDVRIYVNGGTGVFTDQTGVRLVPALAEMDDIAVFDADGDGDLDLVAATPGVTQDRFYRNNGSGVFTDATSASFGTRRDEMVTAGDVDGDGDTDLVLARGLDLFDSRTELLLNDGTGVFLPAAAGRLPETYGDLGAFGGMALADVDGDVDLDLMLQGMASGRLDIYGSAERLLHNDGSGAFVQAGGVELPASARTIALGDIDHDGDQDVLLAGPSTRLFRNDGKRRFVDISASSPPLPADVTAASIEDFDEDGFLDLFLARGSATNEQSQLWLGGGAGQFTNATATHLPVFLAETWHIAVGDVDGDGDLDIVMDDRLQPNQLLRNDGTGHFTLAPGFGGPPTGGDGVQLADFDGDGDLDLLEGTALRENDGSGSFSPRANLTGLASATIPVVRAGDLDGDGLADILVCHWNAPDQIALNQGAANPWTFVMTSLPPGGSRAADAALFDMDADGDLDIAIVGGVYGELFENLGGGLFGVASDRWYARRQAQMLAVGDMDRDGDLDLVEAAGSEPAHVYYNLHRHHAVPDPADLGADYRVELSYQPGYLTQLVFAALYFSTNEVQVPLPPWGVLGIDPSAFVTMGVYLVPAPAGAIDVDLFVANLPALHGVDLWSQVLFVDGTLPLAPFRLSGALGDTVR